MPPQQCDESYRISDHCAGFYLTRSRYDEEVSLMISADDGRQSSDTNQPPGPTGNDPDKTRITPPGGKQEPPRQDGTGTPGRHSAIPGAGHGEHRVKPPAPAVTPQTPRREPPVDATQLPPGGTPDKQPSPQGKTPPKPPAVKQPDGTRIVPGPSAASPESRPPGQPPKQPPAPPGEKGGGSGDEEIERLRRALSGKYEISRKLGAGGMASVYLAREIALEREVAIKVLPQSFLRDKQFVTRFKREAQVAANLEHPHIVRIYRIGVEENLVYFVMSFIPGGAISDQIKKRGALPVDEIVQWGMDVSSALGYAHDHGVIHRDLKPDNIMLDKSKRAVVMDFGIARAGQGTGLTQTGAVIGTPQFMSPEQARGQKIDSRSDIYSMGLVLYQMATGTLPFTADDAASLMYMHVHEVPEPPDVRNPKVPAWLRDIILKCLAKNPDDRFGHAKELRLALAEHKAPELTEKTIVQKRAEEKKGKGVWIAAAIVIIAAAAAGWFFLNSQKKPAEETMAPQREAVEQPAVQPAPATEQPQVNADDLAYQQAEMINTRQAFSTYIEKYPEGAHADAARAKIVAFNAEEQKRLEQEKAAADKRREEEQRLAEQRRQVDEKQRQAAERLDDDAYTQALTVNTIQSFTSYLQSYPVGRHVEEARGKLTGLNAQAAEADQAQAAEDAKRDDAAFRMAADTNTKEALSTYLISFPAGLHADEARTMIDTISEREAFREKIGVDLSALSITLVDIPPGSFRMGSNDGEDDEKPVRTVSVSGFSMSATEITQGQYIAVMNDNPSFHKLDDNNPVERLTWKEAVTFCNRLSEKLNLESCYNLSSGACDMSKNGFRLPTEAEWEYACRAGTGTEYNTGAGESALNRAAWYQRNSAETTHPVAQKTANSWGLYDMHGNVWEWTNDRYGKRSYETDTNTKDPTGVPNGKNMVLRGGSWLDNPKDCRASKRREYEPDKKYSDIGFRILRR